MKILTEREAILKTAEEKTIFTMCNGCIFSSLQENDNEDLSDYCSIDRLKKLQDNGAEILNVCDTEDTEKNTKLVNGRVCNMLRGKDWAEARIGDGHKKEELEMVAQKETEIKCAAILYMGEVPEKEQESRMYSLCCAMKSLEIADIRPFEFSVINNSDVGPYEFLSYIRRKCEEMDIKTPWKMEYISDSQIKSMPTEDEKILACVDVAVKNIDSVYYCVFIEDCQIPENYLENINEFINKDMQRFLAIVPEKGVNGLCIQHQAHKQLVGNRGGRTIVEKLELLSSEQKCAQIIHPLEKIMNSPSLQ